MQTDRRKTEHGVTRRNCSAIDYFFAIDNPDNESGDIVFTIGVEPRHLRRLSAEQHATVFATAIRDTFDDRGNGFRRELSGGDVIKKEEGARALD